MGQSSAGESSVFPAVSMARQPLLAPGRCPGDRWCRIYRFALPGVGIVRIPIEIDTEPELPKNLPVRKGAPLLATVALVVASLGAPLVHLYQAGSHEHGARDEHGHGRLLHAHAMHRLLHGHGSDDAELAAADEEHPARYLNLFQARTVSGPVLIFLVSEGVRPDEPRAAGVPRRVLELRNHDPPFADWFPARASPA